jgi:DNA polymerase I-like protein with 3'-5' exonuclease and polymerase domains
MTAAAKKELSEGMHEGMAQFLRTVPVEVESKSGKSWAEK